MCAVTVSLVQPRLLNQGEAAGYAGLSPKKFKTLCPVVPVAVAGARLWDRQDLDGWIDQIEGANDAHSPESIAARL